MSTLMGRREDAGYHDGLDQILSNTGSLLYIPLCIHILLYVLYKEGKFSKVLA